MLQNNINTFAQEWNTAIYVRISEEERSKSEFDSVSNQITLLTGYANSNLFNIVDVYEDDGCKGGNFKRPAFQRMIRDIENELINCVLVKDLSRFGREHIEGDYYLEKFFPSKGVRFVAMLDNIDSVADPERMNSIEVPLMNLLNEQYLKDVSNSTKVSLNIKRKEGKFVGAEAPYGYKKAKDDKHKLIVDEEVKPIVERIFSLYIDYHSQSEIARILNDSNVLTPSSYKNINRGKAIKPNSKWTSTTIKKILTQPIYTGDMVQGRTKSYSHKVNKRIPLSKKEWVIIENTHEAIIDKEMFNNVQSMITKNIKPTCAAKPSLFAGLLICSECKKKMQRSIVTIDNKKYSNFVCSTYKKYGKSVCTSHLISEEVISNILLTSLNTIIKTVFDVDKALNAKSIISKEKDLKRINIETSILNSKQVELRKLKQKHTLI